MVKTTSKKNIANEEKSMSAEVEHTQNGKARHLYLMRHGKASKMKKKSRKPKKINKKFFILKFL